MDKIRRWKAEIQLVNVFFRPIHQNNHALITAFFSVILKEG